MARAAIPRARLYWTEGRNVPDRFFVPGRCSGVREGRRKDRPGREDIAAARCGDDRFPRLWVPPTAVASSFMAGSPRHRRSAPGRCRGCRRCRVEHPAGLLVIVTLKPVATCFFMTPSSTSVQPRRPRRSRHASLGDTVEHPLRELCCKVAARHGYRFEMGDPAGPAPARQILLRPRPCLVPVATPSIAIPTTGPVVVAAMWARWCWTGTSPIPFSSAISFAYRVERNCGWRSWATISYSAPRSREVSLSSPAGRQALPGSGHCLRAGT